LITSEQVKKLDALFQEVCLKLEPMSAFSGLPAECAHHIFTRGRRSTRWDPENSVCLTRAEHNHHCPEFRGNVARTYIKRYGKEEYDKLRRKSVVVARGLDYNEIKEKLLSYLK